MTFLHGVPGGNLGMISTVPDEPNHAFNDKLICPHGQTDLTRFSDDDSPLTLQAWRYAAASHEERSGCSCMSRFLDVHQAQAQDKGYWPPA